VYQNQLGVHFGQCLRRLLIVRRATRREPVQRSSFELGHQSRYQWSVSELKATFANIDVPILTSHEYSGRNKGDAECGCLRP